MADSNKAENSFAFARERNQTIDSFGEALQYIASKFQIIVVATNHMSTSFFSKGQDSISRVVPMLGKTWQKKLNKRIITSRERSEFQSKTGTRITARQAIVYDVNFSENAEPEEDSDFPNYAKFFIQKRGIRSVPKSKIS